MERKALKEFKEIYRKKFGEELNDFKALKLAENLLNLYKVVYQIDEKNNEKNYESKRENNR